MLSQNINGIWSEITRSTDIRHEHIVLTKKKSINALFECTFRINFYKETRHV